MKAATGEKRFVHQDGSIIWVQRTMSIVSDDEGKPQYVISIVENISLRKGSRAPADDRACGNAVAGRCRSIAEAILVSSRIMGETLGYAYGARWVLDPTEDVLRCTESWCAAELAVTNSVAGARPVSKPPASAAAQSRGVGNGCPVWIADVAQEATLQRRESAQQADCVRRSYSRYSWAANFMVSWVFRAGRARARRENFGDCAHGKPTDRPIHGRKQAEAALQEANDQLTHQRSS